MNATHTPSAGDSTDALAAAVRGPFRTHRFRDEPVPRVDVEEMVALAACAASACDTSVWRFIAVEDHKLLTAMGAAVIERFEELALRPGLALQEKKRVIARAQALLFAKAPLCVAVAALPNTGIMEELTTLCGMTPEEHDRLCTRPELQSVGAAVQLLISSAAAMGYGAWWTCAPMVAADRLEALLDVAPPARLVALVAVGRPAGALLSHKSLPLQQALSFR